MRTMIEQIKSKKSTLERSRLIEYLIREDIPGHEKLSFAPAMVFFVMGFCDILRALRFKNPTTWIERTVNKHCDEDVDHWRWYAQDLERLGFDRNVWGTDLSTFLSRFWSDETWESRYLIYLTMHYARSAPNPVGLLVIIEVMEATFGVFSDALYSFFRNTSTYSDLKYFGGLHRKMENNHTIGSWLHTGSHADNIYAIHLSPGVREFSLHAVEVLFDQFHKTFDEWYRARNSYVLEPKRYKHAQGYA